MELVTSWDLEAARGLAERLKRAGRRLSLAFVERLIADAELALSQAEPLEEGEAPAPELTPRQQMVLGDIDFELRRCLKHGPLPATEDARARAIMAGWRNEDLVNRVVYDWTEYKAALLAERNGINGKRSVASRRHYERAAERGAET